MPTKCFGTVRQKSFDGILWCPLLSIKLFDTPNFLKPWTDAHEMFRHCERKNFRRKIVIPLLCIKLFDTPNFLRHWRNAHEIFRHCETKKLSMENCDTHIMHKNVRYPKFSETMRGCPRNFSALWDQNFPTGKRDTPVFILKTFWNRIFSQKQWGSLTKVFGTVRQKIFDGKLWYPLLSINVFDTPNFLKHWRGAHQVFRHCETKTFRRENVIPPFSSIKLFETVYFLRNSGISNESFPHCETKSFRRKIVIPPSKHKLFRYPNFSETLNGCPRNFLALWDKKFSTENCDTHIMHKIVRYSKISETLKRWQPNFSALWDQNFPTVKRDTPVFIHKIFRNRNFSQKQWDSLTKFCGTVRQKDFDGKLWYPYYA